MEPFDNDGRDRKINPALHKKYDNLQYAMVGRWVDGTIVLPSDGPMFILIDWELMSVRLWNFKDGGS